MITEGNLILLKEERIKNDVVLKKLEKKLHKTQDELDYMKIEKYIKMEYPDGLDEIKHKKLIEQGARLMPMKCTKCQFFKVFPFDFMGINGRDYGTNRCNVCTEKINKPCKKYQASKKITCECGICYVGTDLAIANHMVSQQHKDRMSEMIFGFRYTQKELIGMSQFFKIPYYKSLTKNEMIEQLRPKLQNDIERNESNKYTYKCFMSDKKMYLNGTHKWEEYKEGILNRTIS